MTMTNKDKLLKEPHIAPLTELINRWREDRIPEWIQDDRIKGRRVPTYHIPWFDPCGGGVGARVLFLMEKPGPGRGKRGVEYVSQDNEDPTARNMTDILNKACIERSHVVFWNAIPAWDGKRDIEQWEIDRACVVLPELLVRLPSVKVVVGVGLKAQGLLKEMSGAVPEDVPQFGSYHPSNLVKNRWPAKYDSIADVWLAAYKASGF
jgi:uracil-DNA glycosylase